MILAPIARFCLRRAISAPEALELFKSVFIAVAERELERAGHTVNVSRLSAMSGLNRREVMRLRKSSDITLESLSVAARVLGRWQGDAHFLGPDGEPRPLRVQGDDGEFRTLVSSVSKDLNPMTVLFELQRGGSVAVEGNFVRMLQPVYSTRDDVEGAFLMLSRDTADLITAVEENTFGDRAVPHLHGTTHYDKIVPSAREVIESWLLREGTQLHQRARAFLGKFDADLNPGLPRSEKYLRVSLGTFGISQDAKSPLRRDKE